LRHRAALGTIVGEVVRRPMNRQAAVGYHRRMDADERRAGQRRSVREPAESELLGLHEGNFARYRIKPAEYRAWRGVWSGTAT
jgi:hypothetical protein